jgi:hypothetical protein
LNGLKERDEHAKMPNEWKNFKELYNNMHKSEMKANCHTIFYLYHIVMNYARQIFTNKHLKELFEKSITECLTSSDNSLVEFIKSEFLNLLKLSILMNNI